MKKNSNSGWENDIFATKYNKLTVFTDGGARGNPGMAACGWLFKENDTTIISYKKFLGKKTNNQAEYYGLYFALKSLEAFSVTKIVIFMDSELIVKQVQGLYKVKKDSLKKIFQEIMIMLEKYVWSIQHIPRAQNKEADALVNKCLDEEIY